MRNYLKRLVEKPSRAVLIGYASYVFLTWILLCLPFSWQAEAISPLDNLFIATSAISTTGLVTVNTPDAYSFIGEFIIACAFQVGGLGYMTLGSFIIVAHSGNLSLSRRQIGETVFSLPDRINLRMFIKHTIIYTFFVELSGIFCLWYAFSNENVPNALWAAVFHSISAFCTAGFSVFPSSLVDFRGSIFINVVITILSLLGAIGFIVATDVWLSFTSKVKPLTLTTKIIIYATFSFIVGGWIFLFLFDESIVVLPVVERLLVSGFQSMTAMTTVGFNTHPIESLSAVSILVTIVLMVIGASPSGTGGGLKTTSIAAALGTIWSSLRGQDEVLFAGRSIPSRRLLEAFAALSFYLLMFIVGSTLLLLVQSQAFEDVIFESASALGTVGLSRGITGDLTAWGKLIVTFLMFVGRLGPITFGLAFFSQSSKKLSYAEEDIAI